MSDLHLGVLLVIGAMTLIFFGPELGRNLSRKYVRSRKRLRRSHAILRKHAKLRARRVIILGRFAHD
jgi:membrane protein DedA with SNARE-associated domain